MQEWQRLLDEALMAVALLLGALYLSEAALVSAQNRAIPSVPQNVQVTAGDAQLTPTGRSRRAGEVFPALNYEIDWYAGGSPSADEGHWNVRLPKPNWGHRSVRSIGQNELANPQRRPVLPFGPGTHRAIASGLDKLYDTRSI